MTAYFIFEFRTDIKSIAVKQKLHYIWTRYGWDIDVYKHEKNTTLVCNLLYYFGDDPECRNCIQEILEYLFNITVDGHVYYYRFEEATYEYFRSKQKITMDMLFNEYEPNLGGKCFRYEILKP